MSGATVSGVDPIAADAGVSGESVRLDAGEVALHAVLAGPEDGPLVVLLHGFPEFWYAWHRQIEPLVAAGFRVVVPDQRGYNRSDKPEPIGAYHLDRLAADIVGLLDALDRRRAHLVGHDWGGGVAWWTALHHAERVDRLVTINAPHPSVMLRRLRTDWGQRLRSWYLLPFQLPVLPELFSRLGNWAPTVAGMRRSSNPGTFTATDFKRYRRAWSQPGAFTAMLHWYRAAGRRRPQPVRERVTVPTLVVWGTDDGFLTSAMARESADQCAEARLQLIENATHWLHHEQPALIADAVERFLAD